MDRIQLKYKYGGGGFLPNKLVLFAFTILQGLNAL